MFRRTLLGALALPLLFACAHVPSTSRAIRPDGIYNDTFENYTASLKISGDTQEIVLRSLNGKDPMYVVARDYKDKGFWFLRTEYRDDIDVKADFYLNLSEGSNTVYSSSYWWKPNYDKELFDRRIRFVEGDKRRILRLCEIAREKLMEKDKPDEKVAEQRATGNYIEATTIRCW